MHIDRYKKGGGYEAPNGVFYEKATSFLQSHVLGFCDCGRPAESLAYVRDVLEHIDNRQRHSFEEWIAAGEKLFPCEGAKYFAFYVMDKEGLTEHGSGLPGWLTDKGRELLEDLKEYLPTSGGDGNAESAESAEE